MTDAPGVPSDVYYMAGNRGQYVVIAPSMNAVIVRRGYDANGGAGFEINDFTRDVLLALQAADDERAWQRSQAELETQMENMTPKERAKFLADQQAAQAMQAQPN